jgi:hypothetical protein
MNTATAQYLFEGISADVVKYLVERDGMTLNEAIFTFHNSETFAKLEDFETELYIESSAYIYAMLKEELRYGKLT